MDGYWTPSGDTVNITNNGVLTQFADQVEGVARISNLGDGGFFALTNNDGDILNYIPVLRNQDVWVAFGARQNYVITQNITDFYIQPGYAIKSGEATRGMSVQVPAGALFQRDGDPIFTRDGQHIINLPQS